MMNYEKLKSTGVDMEELRKRLMGNDALIPVFIRKFCEDANFAALQKAISVQDWKQAELSSHSLKGMCGNLALHQLFGLFTEQVNLIRSGDCDAAAAMMPELVRVYSTTTAGMKEWLAQA